MVPVCVGDVSNPYFHVTRIVVHLVGTHRIGDWYPERNIFQILIAINSGENNAQMPFFCSD